MAESIRFAQRELYALYAAVTGHNPAAAAKPAEPAISPEPISADDAELLELGRRQLGPTFRKLIEGDRSNYKNISDADNGAIKDLLHLTGHDEDRTERILRSLPLARAKWDSRRGDVTWLRYSINRILERLKVEGHSSQGKAAVQAATGILDEARSAQVDETSAPDAGDQFVRIPRWRYDQLVAAERRVQQIKNALANPNLRPATVVAAINAMTELEERSTWKKQSTLETDTKLPRGMHIVSKETLERRGGLSGTVSTRHLKTVAELGVLRHQTVGLQTGYVDRRTGEVSTAPRRYNAFGLPEGGIDAALTALANAAPAQPDWGGPDRNQGTIDRTDAAAELLPTCIKHPNAGTFEKAQRTLHCTACDNKLAQSEQVVLTDDSLPLSTIPLCVVTTLEQLVPTGPVSALDKRLGLLGLDIQRDNENATAIAEGLAKLYERANGRAAPPPDEERVWWARQASTDWAELDQGHRPYAVAGGSE
jgi:hypothetical protein